MKKLVLLAITIVFLGCNQPAKVSIDEIPTINETDTYETQQPLVDKYHNYGDIELVKRVQSNDPFALYEVAEGFSLIHPDSNEAKTKVVNEYYQRAANMGHIEAQFKLAVRHQYGFGFPKSNEESFKWFYKAANKGHPDAQINLAHRYREGKGVTQSDTEADKWFTIICNDGREIGCEWLAK